MVATASKKGTMTIIKIRSVITATASPRLFFIRAWSHSKRGHVATTIMVAQTIEVRNGRSIQKLAAMNTPIKSTASVVPVMSREPGVSTLICETLHAGHVP
jgi:hypothetical protein